MAVTASHNPTEGEPHLFLLRWRILFVDEAEGAVHGLRDVLRQAMPDAETEAADSGHDALARMQKQRPDLVVSEHRMLRMDGLELAREIHRNHPRLPILLVSAVAAELGIAAAATQNIRSVLQKPVDPKRFVAAVQSALVASTGAHAKS